MDYLQILKIFRQYYSKNQKYYSDYHPILYYNDEFYTNPFLNESQVEKEEKVTSFKCVDNLIDNYKLGYDRNNFLKLLLRIFRDNNYHIREEDLVNKMLSEYDTLNLHKDYNLKQHKISRIELRNFIYNRDFNRREFYQFCADYFSFIFIIIIDNETMKFYPRGDMKILAPKLVIYNDIHNDRFYQIRINNKSWIMENDIDYKKYFHISMKPKLERANCQVQYENEKKEEPEPKYDCAKLMKMKVAELRTLADDLNIPIQKLNPKKTRMINKKKDELISDILEKN